MTKELRWGTTPWDELDREELLTHVKRMYMALTAAKSAMRLTSTHTPFWGPTGTGGRALRQVELAVADAEIDYDPSDIYCAYFRYAFDFLFPSMIGSHENWLICACGAMWGQVVGKLEKCHSCGGELRPFTWEDLRPVEDKEQA